MRKIYVRLKNNNINKTEADESTSACKKATKLFSNDLGKYAKIRFRKG